MLRMIGPVRLRRGAPARSAGHPRRVPHLLGALLVGLSVIVGLAVTPAGALDVTTRDIDLGTVCLGTRSTTTNSYRAFPSGASGGTLTQTFTEQLPNGFTVTAGAPAETPDGFFAPLSVTMPPAVYRTLGPYSFPITIDYVYTAPDGTKETTQRTVNAVGTLLPDCEGPRVVVPAPIIVDATGPTGATVTYRDIITFDTVDGSVPATCDRPSGSVFPIGINRVTCTARDNTGNVTNESFTITVKAPAPPVLSGVPGDLRVQATSPAGAVASWISPTATDASGASLPVTCTPGSDSVFPLGSTTVTCSATDQYAQITSGRFAVTVQDTTAPILPVQAPISVPATSPAGATVTYPAQTATDIVDGSIPASCDKASGTVFPLGVTLVTCTATDTAGNTATSTFTVTVTNTAPVLTVPANLTVEATGPAGAPVSFTATATDNEDGTAPVTCSPASGATFALGSTTVACTATDAGGLTATGSFTVTVRDTTSPVVTVPANVTATPTGANGATVTWPAATATDLVSGTLTPTCSAASGATFAAGTTTTVTCTATDTAGNTGSASFTVTVQAFTLRGFFDLDKCRAGVVVCNTVKGGAREELEFRVFAGTTELTTTNVVRSITQTPVNCTTGVATGPAQTLATAGLRYEAEDDNRFEYKWTVPRTGTCWQVTVTTTSGSTLSTIVKLRS